MQDFPPKAAGAAAAVSEFESCLSDYLAALKLPGLWAGDVARLVAAADFSAARAALLPSVPGYHAGVHFVPTMLFVLCGFVFGVYLAMCLGADNCADCGAWLKLGGPALVCFLSFPACWPVATFQEAPVTRLGTAYTATLIRPQTACTWLHSAVGG